jgi:hypothetical protein
MKAFVVIARFVRSRKAALSGRGHRYITDIFFSPSGPTPRLLARIERAK